MVDLRSDPPPAVLFRQVTVVAPGLLGGSLALACRRRRLAERVFGVARRQETLDEGMERGAFDLASTDLAAGVEAADLVVIGAPVRATLEILHQLAPHLPAGCLVTDLGSTKSEVMAVAARCLPPGAFIGGHPMAGSHLSGIGAAREDLFQGCLYVLTEAEDTTPEARQRLEGLARGLGANPLWIDAADHDRLVARISHLPHLVACALVACAREYSAGGIPALRLAATGFRDSTRIAAGPAPMWTDICLTNREAILQSLDAYMEELTALRTWLAEDREEDLHAWLEATAHTRQELDPGPGHPPQDRRKYRG